MSPAHPSVHPIGTTQVFEALSRMGLQGTEYGRKVIAAAKPASHTRPDNFTSEQRMAQR